MRRRRASPTAARSRRTSSSGLTASTRRCGPVCSARTRPGSPGRSAIAASSRPRPSAAAGTWYKWALYDRDPIPRWTRGRVTILGDAAHPMLPYLGQGACQAIEDGAVLATALSAEAADPLAGLDRYERTRRPRASRVVLAARERGQSNHLTSRWAAGRRDLTIAGRRRVNRRDPEGRGAAWLADYDASSPDVLAT